MLLLINHPLSSKINQHQQHHIILMGEQSNGPLNFNQKMERIDDMLRRFEVRTGDIVQQQKGRKAESVASDNNFNSRGQIILTPKQIRQNYANAWYLLKWRQLPLCKAAIKSKLVFWGGASVILAWTYGEYYKKKSPANVIQSLPFKFYLKAFAVIFSVTAAYCFGESLFFDQFCDIESPFYQENETRLAMAKRIREKMKGNKDGSFLREMF